MAKYINVENLLLSIKKNAPYIYHMAAPIAFTIPPADVAPVVHARWIHQRNDDDELIVRCSHCHEEWHIADDGTPDLILYDLISDDMLFCPSCGARMDGETDEE